MPPIMGAAAFVMAEFLQVSYMQVVVWAAIPALLYYVATFAAVHFEAEAAWVAWVVRVRGAAVADGGDGGVASGGAAGDHRRGVVQRDVGAVGGFDSHGGVFSGGRRCGRRRGGG